VDPVDLQAGRLVVEPVLAAEGHGGPPGAVVVELVDVEGGHEFVATGRQEVLDAQADRVARVDESVQRHDERRFHQGGALALVAVQGTGIEHPPIIPVLDVGPRRGSAAGGHRLDRGQR
jgi:hypothetical protein